MKDLISSPQNIVVIGDMYVSTDVMVESLEKSKINCGKITQLFWGDYDKTHFAENQQNLENHGSDAAPIAEGLEEAIVDADIVMTHFSPIPKYIIETVCISGLLIAIIIKLYFGQRDDTAFFITQLTAFAVASIRLLPSVGKINAYVNNILYCKPSLDLIYNDFREIEGHEFDSISDEEREEFSFEESIKIKDITYRYPNTDKDVLHNVSLVVPKGKTVAFIGSSGAGKTTLADIVLGLLQPQQGEVLVDNWSIYAHMSAWHKKMGYIPQTIYLSDDNIRNNIAFGIEEEKIDDKAVEQAIKKAQLYDFVQSLPDKLNTFVGDRGIRLSGGQRQRIGIARALYHDPDVLVLDEATSALDNETEQAVMEAIESLQGLKTMIIIAHRLTTIRNADLIYEVENGKVSLREKEEVFKLE